MLQQDLDPVRLSIDDSEILVQAKMVGDSQDISKGLCGTVKIGFSDERLNIFENAIESMLTQVITLEKYIYTTIHVDMTIIKEGRILSSALYNAAMLCLMHGGIYMRTCLFSIPVIKNCDIMEVYEDQNFDCVSVISIDYHSKALIGIETVGICSTEDVFKAQDIAFQKYDDYTQKLLLLINEIV